MGPPPRRFLFLIKLLIFRGEFFSVPVCRLALASSLLALATTKPFRAVGEGAGWLSGIGGVVFWAEDFGSAEIQSSELRGYRIKDRRVQNHVTLKWAFGPTEMALLRQMSASE